MKPISHLMYSTLILLAILQSACNPDDYPSSEISILDNSVCSPPCWENIVPGKTSRDELLAALANIDNLDQSSIVQQDYPNKKSFNHVIHGNLYLEPDALTRVSACLSDETVVVLSFWGDLNLTLGEAIEGFGNPEGVLIYRRGFTVISFLYPSKGFVLRFDTTGEYWKSFDSIVPEMEIKTIDYFQPAYYHEILDLGWFSEGMWDYQESMSRMKPWRGYGEIDKYYK